MAFRPAVKVKSKARVCLIGPAGSGKTRSAIRIMGGLCTKFAMIDTEHGSGAKYAKQHSYDHDTLESYEPKLFVAKIREAVEAGYEGVIIDSLSHLWVGVGGALEMADAIAEASRSKNTFNAWAKVTPEFRAVFDEIQKTPIHVIATMRSKTEYVIERDDHGKNVPKKIGTKPVMRDDSEFEFDIVGDMTQDNTLHITKSRCDALNNAVIPKPGEDLGRTILSWLEDGADATMQQPTQVPESTVKALLSAFSEVSVSENMIQERLGKPLNTATEAQIDELRTIYGILKESPATVSSFFTVPEDDAVSLTDAIKASGK